MLASKDFLLVECENVKRTLRETLRYRYAERTIAKFYDECESRLAYIRSLIDASDFDDEQALYELMGSLEALSRLISSIERSHLEEFSWPFAFALERIAKGICDETTPGAEESIFFFSAEGGVSSYAVYPERSGPGVSRRKINAVVFPRTLRDSVLFHPIIGHEIGHAAFVSRYASFSPLVTTLISGSPLADPEALFQWCELNLGVVNKVDDAFLRERADSWAEEIFCDIFGLIMMGPCFIPAFASLLGPTIADIVMDYVPSHPPYACRAVTLLHAARALDMLYSELPTPKDLAQITRCLDHAFIQSASNWLNTDFAVLDERQVASTAMSLLALGQQYDGFCFPRPSMESLDELSRALCANVPPAGRYPSVVEEMGSGVLAPTECPIIDFRHVLLSGWIRWSQLPAEQAVSDFRVLNQLCSHALLQQEGVVWAKQVR